MSNDLSRDWLLLGEPAPDSGPDQPGGEAAGTDPLPSLQQVLAGSLELAREADDPASSEAVAGESLEETPRGICAGLRQLLAIVSVNSATRFAN